MDGGRRREWCRGLSSTSTVDATMLPITTHKMSGVFRSDDGANASPERG